MMTVHMAAKKFGVSKDTLQSQTKRDIPPPYIVKNEAGRIRVNTDHPAFQRWVDENTNGHSLVPPEFEELAIRAKSAALYEKIHKSELLSYKVEKEKIALQRSAGDLMEVSMGEFLFFGYMEKCNTDLLSMMKRLEPIIINLAKENNGEGIIRRVNKEIKSILIEIKKAQTEDLKKWQKENS